MHWQNIVFSDCIKKDYADSMFGPSNTKRFSVVLVERHDKSFRFSQVLLFFHLKKRLKETITRKFVILRSFDLAAPIDNVDLNLNF